MTKSNDRQQVLTVSSRRVVDGARRVLTGGILALVCMTMACSSNSDSGTPGALGELGDGTFDYRCENTGDLKCSATDAVDEFELGSDLGSGVSIPQAVAVGATFGIRYAGAARDDGDDGFATVSAVSDEDEVGPNVYSIPQPVEAAFVAVDSEQNVIDFTVVTALEATELSLWHNQDELRSVSLEVGESLEVTVAPRSDSGTFLAGALRYDWDTLDDSVASIGELGSSVSDDEVNNEGDIEILGVAEGTTTVRVRSGGLGVEIEVEVTP